MTTTHLHHVWDYTERDREFWEEHLEEWLPRKITDGHCHVTRPGARREPMTEEKREQFWVNEVNDPIDAPDTERCIETIFPGREVSCVAMGSPSLDFRIEPQNEYLARECPKRGWHALALVRPQWDATEVEALLEQPGIIGLKPYYGLISRDPSTRDKHIEADILDYLPHHLLEVANERRAWVTLHVPKTDRLPHPDNIRRVREIRESYPDISLVLAHLGRCYTAPHAREGIPPLADDPGLFWDISAVFNPEVFRITFEHLEPRQIIYGTDNPVFYMRGRRGWDGRQYFNYTSGDFHFNRDRHEPPEVETEYTLFTYEALRTIKETCREFDLSREEIRAIFHDNAARLIGRAGG